MNIRKDINAFILYGLSKCFIDAAVFAFFGYNGCRFSACSSVCCAFCAWILLLSLFKDFFAKTLDYVIFDFSWNLVTVLKSTFLNSCHTIWDIYAGERMATAKSVLSNRCDTIWDIYAGERVAIAKSTSPIVVTLFGIFMLVSDSQS